MRLLPIIGLEIHVRLKTRSKMFCGCPNVADDTSVNTAICPVCTGQPGALPTVNEEAVRMGVRTGIALDCHIPSEAHFDRKNYFYPDLPKGYQISQFDFPIAVRGSVMIDGKTIGLTRAHLEEDAAKNIHTTDAKHTLVDFNRAGNPLLEIVTEPDLRSPAEAKLFLQELQATLRAVGASDADMEKGYMRCDANISLLPVDEQGHRMQPDYHPKTEIKNLNSFRAVERALTYEIARQTALLEKGNIPVGATRGWNEHTGETVEQRLKETSADYRYFPEPDLPVLLLDTIASEERMRIPELPAEKRARFMRDIGFTKEDAFFLTAHDGWADYAEAIMSECAALHSSIQESLASRQAAAKLAGSWLTNTLAGLLTQRQKDIREANITPENMAEFLHLIQDGAINSTNAQKLLGLMMDSGADPSHLLEEHNLGQQTDPKFVEETVTRMIEQNPDQVAQIKAGKVSVIKWFVGGVMKVTEGRANPEQAEKEVKKQLGI